MPQILDNIERDLLETLSETLNVSHRADFCVGYFNLRGWRQIDSQITAWAGDPDNCCRLLVGMHRSPQDELQNTLRFARNRERIDNRTALQLKRQLAEDFRWQLTIGAPTNEDEAGLRRLAEQLRSGRLIVKLFLRHPLHAKLYLLFRQDAITPIIGYLGSSNLTLSGLSGQGELNVDVVDQDACKKLARWFEDRWNDRWCLDISEELAQVIEESWAGESLIPPYHIYLKMAYHLSHEARVGVTEFSIPRGLRDKLFEFQAAAVKIAARHLNQRGGVLLGDVVGLGKTLMATTIAKVFEEDHDTTTLIICPKNLVKMWESYRDEYHLRARVLSITRVLQELPELRRYRLVLIDESHNLRNREGKRYRVIQEYIQKNDSRCILLSATPYNKSYLDLASQLRLFISETDNVGIRPEALLREIGEVEFTRRHQCSPRSLEAFEKSEYATDWQELMRLFMVRRTRSFVRDNYAELDSETGRKYLIYADGSRAYFPTRHPMRVSFPIDPAVREDQYARLYAVPVVEAINQLNLPRYGLGNYVLQEPAQSPSEAERRVIQDLSRGGRRLMGFCRTNLFKRLESSGYAFLLSVERHILRNHVFVHAIENGLPLPIGTQDAEMLDARFEDEDAEAVEYNPQEKFDSASIIEEDRDQEQISDGTHVADGASLAERAAAIYQLYATDYRSRFRWIRASLFHPQLAKDLKSDIESLESILLDLGTWNPTKDTKLAELHRLITDEHPREKVLIFSQFADTVRYLEGQLRARGNQRIAGVTGDSPDPTALAWRFSPGSNEKRDSVDAMDELRILIATDVLSEGQNLQDCHIVVNYDLPWAIIRLIQRAGRVDRIGQQSPDIRCYTFWPADGVERIIHLRERLRERLRENAEVVGTDEMFFEDDTNEQPLLDLYHEKAGILDDEDESDVDLVSYAYQIWKNATDANPKLKTLIPKLPPVIYATKELATQRSTIPVSPETGVLVYLNTSGGNSALAWINASGESVTESQFAILRVAACSLETPALPRQERHHELVREAVDYVMTENRFVGGQLGRPSGARFRTYERLRAYADQLQGTLFGELPASQTLLRAIDQIYRFPLRENATQSLNRQLRSGIQDDALAELVLNLYEEDRLCLVEETQETQEPRIICSMGLI